MSTMVAVVEEEIDEALRGGLPGKLERLELDLLGYPLLILEDEGPRALASDVARKAPDVLVAGVTLGGNAWNGMEGVRRVLKAPRAPAVVVLTPVLTEELASLGRRIGVYGFIGTRGRSVAELVAKVREAVGLASSHRALVLQPSPSSPARRAPGAAPSTGRRGPSRAGKK